LNTGILQLITRLNTVGFGLCPKSKYSLLDEAAAQSRQQLLQDMMLNPLVKITGDNLDIYVRTNHITSENHSKDLHMFTSNIILSRIATTDLDNRAPQINSTEILPEDCLLNGHESHSLLTGYAVILGRLLADKFSSFSWMKRLLPQHLNHEYSWQMAQPSVVHPLPLLNKNETKYEECTDILDSYEKQLISLFKDAYGATLLSFVL